MQLVEQTAPRELLEQAKPAAPVWFVGLPLQAAHSKAKETHSHQHSAKDKAARCSSNHATDARACNDRQAVSSLERRGTCSSCDGRHSLIAVQLPTGVLQPVAVQLEVKPSPE